VLITDTIKNFTLRKSQFIMPYLADIFGITGVSLILFAFFLNLFNRISQDAYAYVLMNLVGGILACISSVLIHSIAFTILEGT